jgi:hypothetical protein
VARLAAPYRPRKPTETILYGVVRDHLETFLAYARDTYERPLPRYVEREFREFLRCGVFANGFVHCACDACGRELLVAFSCKRRGVCPSCAGRRMANTGAHLVDRVVPDLPLRQFVLTLPHELRMLAAFKPDVLTALSRIFVKVVFASFRKRAAREGIVGGVGGAVTLIQRFGGSLNANLHYHVCFLDGVFTRDEAGRARFHALPPPSRSDLDAIVRRVHDRAVVWLRKRGYVDADALEERSQAGERGALEACATIAMQRGAFVKLLDAAPPGETEGETRSPFVAEHEGFNLHAGVHIAKGDDLGREKLLRYGARPALALDRLRRLPDGKIAYRVKYARTRSKYRVMTAVEFLARLSALIPPPYFPLLRLHGVLGPRSAWRKDVVPKPRDPARSCSTASGEESARPRTHHGVRPRPGTTREDGPRLRATTSMTPDSESIGLRETSEPLVRPQNPISRLPRHLDATHAPHPGPDVTGASPAPDPSSVLPNLLAPNVLSVSHWNRLARGELYAATRRVPWRQLLARTFEVDVAHCSACGGRVRVVGAVVHPFAARRVLERLGMPTLPPLPARARDPTYVDASDDGSERATTSETW